jgi:hypothetical protein
VGDVVVPRRTTFREFAELVCSKYLTDLKPSECAGTGRAWVVVAAAADAGAGS